MRCPRLAHSATVSLPPSLAPHANISASPLLAACCHASMQGHLSNNTHVRRGMAFVSHTGIAGGEGAIYIWGKLPVRTAHISIRFPCSERPACPYSLCTPPFVLH